MAKKGSKRTSGIIGIVAGIIFGYLAYPNMEQSGIWVMTIPAVLVLLGLYYVIKD